jgi:membrane-associated protease RseP (regulator of RpoE activity)
MIDLEIVSTLVFFAVVGILLLKDRKKIEFNYGIIIRRWQKGKQLIDKLVAKNKRLVTIIGNIGVVVGIIAGLFGLYFLISSVLRLEQGFALVLPSVGGYRVPGPVLSIPFWYWLIGIFTIIASHESMHAVFARLEKVPIKSYGVLLFLVFPIGAFVDPDMVKIKKLKLIKKLRIYAAGSFANLILALITFLLITGSISLSDYFIEPAGIRFDSVVSDTPAAEVGLSGIIYKINNHTIKSRIDLIEVLNQTKIGDNITIFTTSGIFVLKTAENPDYKNTSYIGISNVSEVYRYKIMFSGYVPEYVISSFTIWLRLLMWLFVLNVGVGVVNLLPMKPFDGGLIFEEIFEKISKEHGKNLINITSVVTAALILFNLFGTGLIKLFI